MENQPEYKTGQTVYLAWLGDMEIPPVNIGKVTKVHRNTVNGNYGYETGKRPNEIFAESDLLSKADVDNIG